jgi:hypothetical protein
MQFSHGFLRIFRCYSGSLQTTKEVLVRERGITKEIERAPAGVIQFKDGAGGNEIEKVPAAALKAMVFTQPVKRASHGRWRIHWPTSG